jgi:hypothetical protein
VAPLAAPISMTQMVYDSLLCENGFIKEALETIGKLNNIALDNYDKTLMKVRTQQAEGTSLTPYLEHFSLLTLKAYFTNNNTVTSILPMYINRNIITLGDMINEINYPTISGGFLNNEVIKAEYQSKYLRVWKCVEQRELILQWTMKSPCPIAQTVAGQLTIHHQRT